MIATILERFLGLGSRRPARAVAGVLAAGVIGSFRGYRRAKTASAG